MLNFLLRRSGQSVVVLFLVSVIGFAALNLAPGGPLSQYALTPGMSQQTLHRLAEQMGLNRPLPVQYFDWLSHLLRGTGGVPTGTGSRFCILFFLISPQLCC